MLILSGDNNLLAFSPHHEVVKNLVAGTGQSQGEGQITLVSATQNVIAEFSTVANEDDAGTLPPATLGRRLVLANNGANTLQLFPAVGEDLGRGLNVAELVATGKVLEFVCIDAGTWQRVLTTLVPQSAPILTTEVLRVIPGLTWSNLLDGAYFLPTMTAEIDDPELSATLEFSTDNRCRILITATSEAVAGFYDLTLNNGLEATFVGKVQVMSAGLNWVDLRLGGDTFTTGTTGTEDVVRQSFASPIVRDAAGLMFSSNSLSIRAAKFRGWEFLRSDDLALEWIVRGNTPAIMHIGIGSANSDYTTQNSIAQFEVAATLNLSTNISLFNGNNGTVGSGGTHNTGGMALTADPAIFYKFRFEQCGKVGSTFRIFQLPSGDPGQWDDTSNPIHAFVLGGTLAPDEPVLCPMIMSQNASTDLRLLAFRVLDMS